jgi:YihY family inner membrane protein
VDLARSAETVYNRVDDWSGGRLGILRRAIESFGETRAAQAAAAMAYYAFFSLFPLLLVLVSVTSFFMAGERARQEAVSFVTEVIPVSRGLIEQNIRRVFELRGPVGIVGLIGLLWSATGVFTVLAYNVNRAWSGAEPRGFLRRRLVGLVMIGVLLILLMFSLLSSALLNLMPRLQIPLGISLYETVLWAIVSRILPLGFTFLLFLTLYRWVPRAETGWAAASGGALLAALAWEVVKNLFVWYLSSGLVQYELVYGSLGTVAVLMLWIYLSGWIALFGAHFSAALSASENA